MPIVSSTYQRPRWLPTGHLQSIYAQFLPRPSIRYRRERMELPDGDFIDLDWSDASSTTAHDRANKATILVFFHGLEGSSASQYCLHTLREANANGWSGVVAHFRGCSGEPNRLARSYHSGDSEHVHTVLSHLRDQHPHATIFAAGVSLGGNALTKWCGEQGEQASQYVAAAASICSPLDLAVTSEAIQHFNNLLFNRYFMQAMGKTFAQRIALHPELQEKDFLTHPHNFPQFDEHYTAPAHGFTSAWDYYEQCSSRRFIGRVRLPFLLLNPINDPFVPAWLFPKLSDVSDNVTLEQPHDGGHVGFVTGSFPGKLDWLPKRLIAFFKSYQHARA